MGHYGIIYVLHNKINGENVFKVGHSTRPVEKRIKELNSQTATIGDFRCLAHYVVSDSQTAEARCHKRLSPYKYQENKEFFSLELSQLLNIIEEAILPFKAFNYSASYKDIEQKMDSEVDANKGVVACEDKPDPAVFSVPQTDGDDNDVVALASLLWGWLKSLFKVVLVIALMLFCLLIFASVFNTP